MEESEVRNRINIGCTKILLAPLTIAEGLRGDLGCCEPERKDEQAAYINISK